MKKWIIAAAAVSFLLTVSPAFAQLAKSAVFSQKIVQKIAPPPAPAPTVAFVSPSGGQTVKGTVSVKVKVTPADGAYAKVVLSMPGHPDLAIPKGGDDEADWDTSKLPNQNVLLTASVLDSANKTLNKASVTVTVANPVISKIEIVSPASGATLGGDVTVRAKATPPLQPGEKFRFSISDGQSILNNETSDDQWTFDSTVLPNGQVGIMAYGISGLGSDFGKSAVVTARIANPAPQVSIASPAPGAVVKKQVTVKAAATPALKSGAKFRFSASDGQNILTQETQDDSFTFDFSKLDAGEIGLQVSEVHNGDELAKSAVVKVTNKKDTEPPSVSIISPADGDTLKGKITIKADVKDDDQVASVDISYEDGMAEIKNPQGPYAIDWDTAKSKNGPYTIAVTATDVSGNHAVEKVKVTVDNKFALAVGPMVTFTSPAQGAKLSGSVTLSAKASPDDGFDKLKITLPGGREKLFKRGDDYEMDWNTKTEEDGQATIRAEALDADGKSVGGVTEVVTINNNGPAGANGNPPAGQGGGPSGPGGTGGANPGDGTTPYGAVLTGVITLPALQPAISTIAISSPSAGSTVKGTVTIKASASAAQGLDKLRFSATGMKDEFVKAGDPYEADWDTTAAPNGPASVTVTALDKTGKEIGKSLVTVQAANAK